MVEYISIAAPQPCHQIEAYRGCQKIMESLSDEQGEPQRVYSTTTNQPTAPHIPTPRVIVPKIHTNSQLRAYYEL